MTQPPPAEAASRQAHLPQPDSDHDSPDVHGHLAKLFGRDTVYLILWGLQLGLAAIVTPFATRLLGTSSFGAVVAAIAVMQVLFVLVSLSLNVGIERRFFESDGLHKARVLMTVSTLLSIVVTMTAWATGQLWYSLIGFDDYSLALQYAVVWAGLSGVTACGLSMLRSQDRLLAFSTVSLLQSVVAEVTSLLFVGLWSPTAAHFLLGQLIAQAVAVLCVFAAVRPVIPRRRDAELVTSTLRYTTPLVPAALSAFALSSIDRLILQEKMGQTSVARYQIAYNIGSMPLLLLSVLNGVWMPRFFSLTGSAGRAALLAAARDMLFRLLVPVMIGLSFGAPLVLRTWAPARYEPDRLLIVLFLIVVTTVPFAAGLSTTRTLLTTGHSGTIAAASMTAALLNVGLNFVMIDAYGLSGAAAATLISYTALDLMLQLKARKVLAVPPTAIRLRLGLLAAGGASWGLALLPDSPVFLVVRGFGAIGCLVWFGVIGRRVVRRKPASAELDKMAVV